MQEQSEWAFWTVLIGIAAIFGGLAAIFIGSMVRWSSTDLCHVCRLPNDKHAPWCARREV